MLEELQRRDYSQSTARIYLHVISDFAKHFRRSPDTLGPEQIRQYQLHRVCQVICVNDLGFVVGVDLGVELGLMLVQSSVTRRRRGCGNVGIPRLLRDFQVRWERWKSRGRTFPRVPPHVISTAKLFPGSCGEPVFVGC
jgi:hypothetical protein